MNWNFVTILRSYCRYYPYFILMSSFDALKSIKFTTIFMNQRISFTNQGIVF